MSLDRSTRLFTAGSDLLTQETIVGANTALVRSTSLFGIGSALASARAITGTVDEVGGEEQDLHPILWGGYFLMWGGIPLVW